LVIRCSEGGSLRRKKEVVKDFDLLVSSDFSSQVMELFYFASSGYGSAFKGGDQIQCCVRDGINADLRVVTDLEFPYALHHFTGSKEHNTALRHLAKQQGIKMNEYGLFKNDELIKCKDEEDIFRVFGMSYIPPELRENNGELEAAAKDRIPHLITESDIKGIIHIHSNYSDGRNTLEELARYCMEKGYLYMGITDHSQTAFLCRWFEAG
jgi:DNA polymerase (family 10)